LCNGLSASHLSFYRFRVESSITVKANNLFQIKKKTNKIEQNPLQTINPTLIANKYKNKIIQWRRVGFTGDWCFRFHRVNYCNISYENKNNIEKTTTHKSVEMQAYLFSLLNCLLDMFPSFDFCFSPFIFCC
jgi:hypothetical protein